MFGDLQFWIGAAITALILYFGVPKRLKKYIAWFVFLVLPSVTIGYATTHTLKLVFKVPRPCYGLPSCPTSYSFPSGHATVIFAAMTTMAFHYKNKKLALMLFLFAGLVALSRVMLNVHYPTDIVVGSFIGMMMGLLIGKAYKSYIE
jgi:undecaprenyl-diphosphatase